VIALALFLLFVVLPIAELYVIVQVAGGIGILETIALLILIGAAGAWLCKREGVGILNRIQSRVQRGEVPTRELIDGGLIMLAGTLLLAPGFITDVLAILLLLPPTRAIFRAAVGAVLARRAHVVVTTAGAAYGSRRVIDTTGSEGP
jgi:UPF0716 protein FxsA